MKVFGRYRADAAYFAGSLLSAFGAMHFTVSLYFWALHLASGAEGRFQPANFITCGVAGLLLALLVLSFILFVRDHRRAWAVLCAGLVFSILFFVTDVKRDHFQLERPVSRVERGTSTVVLGRSRHNLTWWWYSETDYRIDTVTGTESEHASNAGFQADCL